MDRHEYYGPCLYNCFIFHCYRYKKNHFRLPDLERAVVSGFQVLSKPLLNEKNQLLIVLYFILHHKSPDK